MKKSLAAVRITIVVALFITLVTTNAQAAADLTIYRASITGPNPVVSYQQNQVQYGIKNEGDEKSSQFTVTAYLSEDEDFTDDDYELDVRNYGGIPPGDIRTAGCWFVIPADFSNGDYYIGVVLEPWDGTPVTTRTAGTITVARPIDLRVGTVSVDAAASSGEQLVVLVVIYNDGMGVSDSFTIDCYIDQYLIGSDIFGPLDPDESNWCMVYCDIPDDIPDDNYYIRAVVSCESDGDSGNDEGESDSTWVGSPIDLAVQSVQIAPGAYLPGEDFVIYSLIENISGRDSESYTVDYYASTDAIITASDYHIAYVNRSGLSPGEQHSYETKCAVPFNIAAGNYYIGIIITCPDEYDPANNVGRNSATVELVHPDGYVCGQMKYKDMQYREHPIRYALVKIYEDDNNDNPLDDRVIGQTYTDHNGGYGVIVLNDDQSGQDIYVKVFTDSNDYPGTTSKICDVKDDIFGETYSLKSPLYLHPRDSSVIVDMTAPKSRGAFMVCDSVIEGFHKAKTFFDVNLPEITTYWPSSEDSSYYIPSVGIFISQDDRGDRDVIMHEYGHYIAEIYGFAQGSVGENPTHYWNLDLRDNPVYRTDEEARNLAFREAWASLFSIATQYGDTWYPNSGDTRYQDVGEESGGTLEIDLEEDTGAHDSPGQYFGNMNCCALWDIFDDHNDEEDNNDTLSDTSLSKIWTISRDYQPDDIIDFWNSWFQSYNYASEITRIFRDHEMSFPKPEQTNPTP